MTVRLRTTARGWAYTGAGLGGLVSVAANVAHSLIPPQGAPAGWHAEHGAVAGAVVWPVFLLVAVEILARTTWPTGRRWWLLRFGGLLPVAGVAAFVSYTHLSGLLAHYGEQPIVHTLGPLAVDGLMVMATGALLATAHQTSGSEQPSSPAAVAEPNAVPAVPATPIPAPSRVDRTEPSHLDTAAPSHVDIPTRPREA